MATFLFKARTASRKREKGVINADTAKQARERLRERGLQVEVIEQRRSKVTIKKFRFPSRRRYQLNVTVAIREMSTLLQAGIPLLTVLDSLILQASGGFADCLIYVRDKVASGSTLAESMESEPSVFDTMTIGLIRIGEHAGNLDEVCQQIADYRERNEELSDRVISSIIYPAIVLLLSIVVTLFLMTAVVPMLLSNLIEMGRPLPLPTRILKWASDTLLSHGVWIGLIALVITASLAWLARTSRGQLWVATMLLKSPVLGTLIQKQTLSRMSLILSSLLKSGVELVEAFRIAESSTGHVLLKSALRATRTDLESGRSIAVAMSRHAIFTPSIRQVFILGEQSGKLDSMLLRIGIDYDKQAATLSTRFAAVIEPFLIVVLSVVVGFVLVATVLPILEAGNVLAD